MKSFLEVTSAFGLLYCGIIVMIGLILFAGIIVCKEFFSVNTFKKDNHIKSKRKQRFETIILIVLFTPAVLGLVSTVMLALEEPLQPVYMNLQNGIEQK